MLKKVGDFKVQNVYYALYGCLCSTYKKLVHTYEHKVRKYLPARMAELQMTNKKGRAVY